MKNIDITPLNFLKRFPIFHSINKINNNIMSNDKVTTTEEQKEVSRKAYSKNTDIRNDTAS